uniref:Cytochrome c-type biogenesis protein CcmF_ii n=1 Tax=Euplotes cristatus TaxID=756077 RepID=UPI002E75CDF0|nr:Cytochrome c-type biogenesis protein CcmF_ii [Euplotes cristatus]UPM52052.1 Cytochrome c-type biogenesis protein CcmF_ii [Euplotes cristatus]
MCLFRPYFCVFVRFRNMFLWLKFTTITPSFYFRNRLFIERGFRVNNMYTFMGSTQKSFTWLPTSSSNLSLYWFRRRGAMWLFFFISLCFMGFFFFDFSHFTPLDNTQVVRALCYVFWRTIDCVFFFFIHFFIFFFAGLSWGLRYVTNFASTRYWASAIRNKFFTYSNSAPQDQLSRLRATSKLGQSHGLVVPTLAPSASTFTNATVLALVGDLYRVSVVTAPVLGWADMTRLPSQPSLLSSNRPNLELPPLATHSCFFLQTILPRTVSLDNRSAFFLDPNSLGGFHGGFLSSNSIDCVYTKQITSMRTVRWLFRNFSSVNKDTSYIRNLLSCTSGKQLLPFIGEGGPLGPMNPSLALEWFGFRSTYLARPFLVESWATYAQKQQQHTPLTLTPHNIIDLGRVQSVVHPQLGPFLWEYWSSLFTSDDYLVLKLGNLTDLKRSSYCGLTTRRWF